MAVVHEAQRPSYTVIGAQHYHSSSCAWSSGKSEAKLCLELGAQVDSPGSGFGKWFIFLK